MYIYPFIHLNQYLLGILPILSIYTILTGPYPISFSNSCAGELLVFSKVT